MKYNKLINYNVSVEIFVFFFPRDEVQIGNCLLITLLWTNPQFSLT